MRISDLIIAIIISNIITLAMVYWLVIEFYETCIGKKGGRNHD